MKATSRVLEAIVCSSKCLPGATQQVRLGQETFSFFTFKQLMHTKVTYNMKALATSPRLVCVRAGVSMFNFAARKLNLSNLIAQVKD